MLHHSQHGIVGSIGKLMKTLSDRVVAPSAKQVIGQEAVGQEMIIRKIEISLKTISSHQRVMACAFGSLLHPVAVSISSQEHIVKPSVEAVACVAIIRERIVCCAVNGACLTSEVKICGFCQLCEVCAVNIAASNLQQVGSTT